MLIPVGFQILVKPDEIEKVSDGGIVLVQDEKSAKVATTSGTIVGIGPIAWCDYNRNYSDPNYRWVEVGDKVLYARYGGKWIADPNTEEEFVLLRDEDILCKIIKEEEYTDE